MESGTFLKEKTMKTRLMIVAVMAVMASACGKAAPAKGSGAKAATAAKDSNQKASSSVTGSTSKAQSTGTMKDGVSCDASLEGVGFCASETTVAFCSNGQWWALECSALDSTAFCGVDTDGALDCWLAAEATE
jgi:hypothetical protein